MKAPLIIIPAHNEERTLADLLSAVASVAAEVVVVDDGSTDHTAFVARSAGCQVIRHTSNHGTGAAIKSGVRYAINRGHDSVVTLDADGQHDPALIPQLIEALETSDLVVGNRFAADLSEIPDAKVASNLLGCLCIEALFGVALPDVSCGYRALRARERILALPGDRFDFLSDVLCDAITSEQTVRSKPVPAIYVGPPEVTTRAGEITGFLNSVLRWASPDTDSFGTIRTFRDHVQRRDGFTLAVLAHRFDFQFVPEIDAYAISTGYERAREAMQDRS